MVASANHGQSAERPILRTMRSMDGGSLKTLISETPSLVTDTCEKPPPRGMQLSGADMTDRRERPQRGLTERN